MAVSGKNRIESFLSITYETMSFVLEANTLLENGVEPDEVQKLMNIVFTLQDYINAGTNEIKWAKNYKGKYKLIVQDYLSKIKECHTACKIWLAEFKPLLKSGLGHNHILYN